MHKSLFQISADARTRTTSAKIQKWLADLPPAPQMTARGRTAFAEYLAEGPHKAFAISTSGSYGYSTALRSADEAEKRALTTCMLHAPDRQLYAVDDQLRDTIPH